MLLNDKVAIITGAGQGIGKAIAEVFLKQGAQCVLWDVNENALSKCTGALGDLATRVTTDSVDVSKLDSVQKATKKVIDTYSKVDILINNAGITRDNLIMRMDERDWDLVINVNLKGVFNCTKSVGRYMVKSRCGSIVNISSVIGLMGNAGQCNYAASKAGVIGLTKATAREFARRGVTVNAIAPGFITTAMTDELSEDMKTKLIEQIPLGTLGQPVDVANAALFLASDLASYVTGDVVCVSGGMVMR